VVDAPNGATARVSIRHDGTIAVRLACGQLLDVTVTRSYAVGAAHMAASWVTCEALSVDEDGSVHDLTIRSFGVLRAIDMPPVAVELDEDDRRPAMNGSDAVFAAVAAAVWLNQGCPPEWPTRIALRT
jgi:CO/xanthine dehydrogenase Mo-binding subunit